MQRTYFLVNVGAFLRVKWGGRLPYVRLVPSAEAVNSRVLARLPGLLFG